MEWDRAWEITRKTFSYTNHTLLPEALETWPVSMFARRLPRHLEIIYQLNANFLDQVSERYPGDQQRHTAWISGTSLSMALTTVPRRNQVRNR